MSAYNQVIENKLYAQNPAPTQESLECLEILLLQESFKAHKPLNDLMGLGLELGLTPYFKRDGLNVENNNFKAGDLIGIYFAKTVSLDKNDSLYIRGKFCGFDLTEATVNLQYFATDKKANDQVIEIAKKYQLESQIIRGSLRVSLAHPQLGLIMNEYIELARS
ncbi:hypothetical protein [Vibrio parahaemolyticus]|uniref:hypothetical protein n=1 Tax=Vibrio parahaemolyticus TaxID=670 RepID=UPI001896644A|nr:hypothetical protein [Vibrio parahaemolyticus]